MELIRSSSRTDTATWPAAAGLAALLFGLGFGLNFGASNQNTYLLGAVRLVDPGTLARDWLATETTAYHRVFSYPAAALLSLDPSGWLFAVVNVIFLAFGAVVVYKLIGAVWETGIADRANRTATAGAAPPVAFPGSGASRLLALVLALLPVLATRSLSAADSTLYTLVFEPATLGVSGFLLGMYLFVRGRYLLSGVALAVGGVFHANYLILALPVFLLAHLLLGRWRRQPRDEQAPGSAAGFFRGLGWALLRQFAVPIVALFALLPLIVPVSPRPGNGGVDILLSIRSPHHYQPLTFRDEFVPLLGWLLLFAAGLWRRETGLRGFSPAVALGVAMTVLVGAGTALTTFVYVPTIAHLYVWRVAPLLVLLAQIFTARMVAGTVTGRTAAAWGQESAAGEPRWLLPPLWRVLAMIVAGECFFYYYYLHHRDLLVIEVLGGILVLALAAWLIRRRASPDETRGSSVDGAGVGNTVQDDPDTDTLPGEKRIGAVIAAGPRLGFTSGFRATAAVTLIALAALAVVAARGVIDHSNLLAGATPESRLYSWARTTTDPDALFLIPPDMDDFRLASRRAVVVDWKSTPFAPDELEEWYRRLDAVSGGLQPRTAVQAAADYANLSPTRLAGIARAYGVQYVVVRLVGAGVESQTGGGGASASGAAAAPTPPPGWTVTFADEAYEVLGTGLSPSGGS